MKFIDKIKSILDKIDILKPSETNKYVIDNNLSNKTINKTQDKIIQEPIAENNQTYPKHINSFIIGRTSFTLIEYHSFLIPIYNELVSLLIQYHLNFKWFSSYEEFVEYYYLLDYDDGYYFIFIG